MIAGGNGFDNPNVDWLQSRGFFLFYLIFIAVFHLVLLSLPISVQMCWTFTNFIHNAANLFFLHGLKGTPWVTPISTAHKNDTHFEQIDFGRKWTAQKKFLTIFPIALFLLSNFHLEWNHNWEIHFIINLVSLIAVTLPKLPSFHRLRIFNINKY